MGIRIWAALAAVVVFAFAGAVTAPAQSGRSPAWAHDNSDLKPDPEVTFGKLPNGMRYAIRRNQNPAGAATITFRIAAGSLHETDEQRGLAHFLEHLAFAGSTNVPRGEFIKSLERLGAKLGRDTNAFTGFDDTTYTLDLAHIDGGNLDTGFMLFREIADRLLLTPESMEAERGVVVAEVKQRSAPMAMSFRKKLAALMPGLRHNDRWVGGERTVLETAPVSQVRKFYEQYYRPERALLIVVGDVDPAAIQAQITALFADWKQPGSAGKDPNLGKLKLGTELRGESYTDPALLEAVSVSRVDAASTRPPTRATYIADFRRDLAVGVMKQRLPIASLQVTASTPRFIDIGSYGRWRSMLRTLEQFTRRMSTYGATQSELTRTVQEARSISEEATADVAGRTNRVIADRLLESVRFNRVFLSIDQHVALRDEVLSSANLTDMNATIRDLVATTKPNLVFVQSPDNVEGGGPALVKAYQDSETVTVDPPVAETSVNFPYTNFGPAGEVANTRALAGLGATEIEFKNGVRLQHKPTDFQKNRILISVRFPGGLLDFPKDKAMLRTAYTDAFVRGGLKQMSYNNLLAASNEHTFTLVPVLGDDAYLMLGATTQADLLFQLQVLAAYTSDAAFSASGLEFARQQYREALKRRRSSAASTLRFEQIAVVTSNDQRWAAPTIETTNMTSMDEVKLMLEPMFKRAIDITIVGDVDAAAAQDAVAKTFGALAKREKAYKPLAGARDVRFPSERRQLTLRHAGQKDQAIAFAAWPGPDKIKSLRAERTFNLLTEVVSSQLFEKLRNAGKAYAPAANNFASSAFPNFGFLQMTVETAPADVDVIYREVDGIVAGIRGGDVSDDAILRARTPLITGIEAEQRTNQYWLWELIDGQAVKRSPTDSTSVISDYQAISKEELVASAKLYLDDKRRVEVRVLPEEQLISMIDIPEEAMMFDWLGSPTPGQLPTKTRRLSFDPAPIDPIKEGICVADPVGCSLHTRPALRQQ